MDVHGLCFILIVKLVVSVKCQNKPCANLTRIISCGEGQRVYMKDIRYTSCKRGEDSLYIACSDDSSCNVEVTVPQGNRQFVVEYYCSIGHDEQCVVLKPETNTAVSCPTNGFIEAEHLKAYRTSRPCVDRYFPENSLYKSDITYVRINNSSVCIPNSFDESALLLYNCSTLTSTGYYSQGTDSTGTTEAVRYYSQDTYSNSFESHPTRDGFIPDFTTTESQMKTRPSFNKEPKFPVGSIVGGVMTFVVVLIAAGILVIRFKRSVTKRSAEADVRHAQSKENASAHQEKNTQNEYFELDPVECKIDHGGKTQNSASNNYFILEKENPKKYSTEVMINGKCQQKFIEANDDVHGLNNEIYDTLGKKQNNSSFNNKQNVYDHLGTMGENNSMYTGTYDHSDRCKRREDDDGVYDVGERNQTDDEYDISGNFNRSLTQNHGLYDVGERKQNDDDYDVSGNFVQSRRENNLYSGMNYV